MFCENCGTKNPDDARFCESCGTPIGVNLIQPGVKNEEISEKVEDAAVPKKLSKKAWIGIGAGIAAFVVLCAVVMVLFFNRNTINLNKYVVVDVEGYNGYGSADAYIDWEAIEEDYGSKVSYTKAAKSEYGGWLDFTTPVYVIADYVTLEADETSYLSNGDEISYTIEIDEEVYDYVNCKLKSKDSSFEVADLKEVDTFDPFESLEVTFNGTDPYGTINLSYSGDVYSTSDFTCDVYNNLKNGDEVVVSISDYTVNNMANTYGKVPENAKKTYTVSSLSLYVQALDDISEDALSELNTLASEAYQSKETNYWDSSEETLQSFTCIGQYLLTPRSSDSYGDKNQLYMVYKIEIHNTYSNGSSNYDQVNTVYWYIEFDDVIVDEDGNFTSSGAPTYYYTPYDYVEFETGISYGWFGTKYWYYYGYASLDELYEDVISPQTENYLYEQNISEDVESGTLETTSTDESGYVLPTSSTELLTEDDLEGLSAEECKIARNEIYARHGRKFQDETLQAYFDACDWYEGTIEPDDFDESMLSDIEIANKDLIVAYEEEMGYR